MTNSTDIIRLGAYWEVLGEFHSLTTEDEFLIANISRIRLALPLELEPNLRPIIGKKIGILRTDIPEKPFLFRVIRQAPTVIDADGD
ncbi:MAG: hypothetical protein MUO26_02870 [Methanotrichaceae archaeon]|nr:hypothetical protein [Methanotrichaceae archaeon]